MCFIIVELIQESQGYIQSSINHIAFTKTIELIRE